MYLGGVPDINILSVSRSKISRVVGKDETVVEWSSPVAYTNYQVRSVPTPDATVTEGVLIESGGGGLAGVTKIITLTDDEVVGATTGPGDFTIKVYARDETGSWSSADGTSGEILVPMDTLFPDDSLAPSGSADAVPSSRSYPGQGYYPRP